MVKEFMRLEKGLVKYKQSFFRHTPTLTLRQPMQNLIILDQ